MQLSYTPAAVSASFDDPNLVSTAGLVPIMRVANEAGPTALAQDRLSVPTDKGANAGAKIASLVSGMTAGAGSINDMDQLTPRRHGHTVRPDLCALHIGVFIRLGVGRLKSSATISRIGTLFDRHVKYLHFNVCSIWLTRFLSYFNNTMRINFSLRLDFSRAGIDFPGSEPFHIGRFFLPVEKPYPGVGLP